MPAKPMQKESRDRKIARALILQLTQADPVAGHKPIRMHFSQNETNAKTLSEICRKGGWRTSRVLYQAKVLQGIAKSLCEAGVLRSWTPPIGTKTISYSLAARWLKALSPSEWGHLSYQLGETTTPDHEMVQLLDSVYPIGGRAQDPVLSCEIEIQLRDSVSGRSVANQPNRIQAH